MMEDWETIWISQKWEEDSFGNMRLYRIHEDKIGKKWQRKLDGPMTKKEYFLRKLEGTL